MHTATTYHTGIKFLLWMLLLFFFIPTHAQTYFHKYLEPSYAWNVFQENDGTYRLIGMTAIENSNDSSNIIFIKLDSLGDVMYQKEISSAYADDNYHAIKVGNKFIVDGVSGNAPPDTAKAAISLIDMEGNLIWHKRYGNNKNLSRYTKFVISTVDNGFIGIGTNPNQDIFLGSNAYVFKTDSIGNFQWCKVYGTNLDDDATGIILTNDGNNIVIVNYGGDNFPSTFKSILMKIDFSGNILWSKVYNIDTTVASMFVIQDIIEVNLDGSLLIASVIIDLFGENKPALMKINSIGQILFTKIFDYNAGVPNFTKTFKITKDSGYAFFTNHTTMFFEGKAYSNSLFKLDKNLNVEWIKMYPNIVTVKDLKQTNDSGFVFVGEGNGYSQTFPGINLPLTIIKTDKYGNSGCFERDTFATTYPITVYDSVFTLQSYDEGFQSPSSTTEFFSPMQSYTHCFCSVTGGFTFTANGDTVEFTNTSVGASAYTWNFGDGNTSANFSPTHVYDTAGTYQVSLIVQDGICVDTVFATITIVGVEEIENPLNFSVYPNPSFSTQVQFTTTEHGIYHLHIFDLAGKLIDNISFTGKHYNYKSKHLSTGLYFYELTNENNVKSRGKLVKR